MARQKRATLTLADIAETRGPTIVPAPEKSARTRRGQVLRLEPEAWRQLKMLAIAEGKTSHDLLIEAMNLLFDRYNRPPIAR